jgi:EAL and modified HD-GYP domain-containing signal transduction protein
MLDFCIVRQPIYDAAGALKGYEIRFRDTEDGRDAFAQSLVTGTFDIVRSGVPAYVSCSRTQLLDSAFQMLNPAATVLLLPRELAPDDEVNAVLEAYRAAGGTIALDDVDEVPAAHEAFGALATWARIDVRQDDLMQLGRICDRVSGGQRKLLADHILEKPQYDMAHQLGFDAFGGEFFAHPEPLPAAQLPATTVAAIRLLGLSRKADINDRQLEDAIAVDPVLTFQLLRLVNSAAVGARGVSSIGQALRLIGRNAFQRWLSVAIAASRKAKTGVDQQLIRQAVERARFLEQMVGGNRDSGTLFLVGLFSLMDSVFRMPLDDILARVALSDEANNALLHRTGLYAAPLEIAESYELGMFENAADVAKAAGMDDKQLGAMYTTALTWAADALSALNAPEKQAA